MYSLYDASSNFNTVLKQLRTDTELTQAELARRSGVGQCMISYIENGRRQPTAITLDCLLMAMGHKLAILADDDESYHSENLHTR